MNPKMTIEQLIENEVTKQLVNRGIASQGWVKAEHSRRLSELGIRITVLEEQVRKLFATRHEQTSEPQPVKTIFPLSPLVTHVRDELERTKGTDEGDGLESSLRFILNNI